MRLLFTILVALNCWALDPRLSNPILLNGGSHASWCGSSSQTGCPTHGYILYDIWNGSRFEVHSMDSDGSHDTCLSCTSWAVANLSPLNQGNCTYGPDSQWIMCTQQASTSKLAPSNQLANPGFCVDCDVIIVDAGFSSTLVAVTNITTGLSQGNLRPLWTRDGTKIWYDHYNGLGNLRLRYATYTPGNPPTIGSNTNLTPTGDQTDSPEPADTIPGENPTCNLIYTALPANIIRYPVINTFNICTSTNSLIYGNGNNYVEFWQIRPSGDFALRQTSEYAYLNAGTDLAIAAKEGNWVSKALTYYNTIQTVDWHQVPVNPSSNAVIGTQPVWSPNGRQVLFAVKISSIVWQLYKFDFKSSSYFSSGIHKIRGKAVAK